MSRFKVGDRIFDTETPHRGIGTISKVLHHEDDDIEYRVIFEDSTINVSRYDNDPYLISESLYNSPLYQALR